MFNETTTKLYVDIRKECNVALLFHSRIQSEKSTPGKMLQLGSKDIYTGNFPRPGNSRECMLDRNFENVIIGIW